MSASKRYWWYAVTTVLWIAWGGAYLVGVSIETPPMHHLGTMSLMLLAGLSTVGIMLSWLVQPVINTAAVWREIGMREQAGGCPDCMTRAGRRTTDAVVLSMRPVKRHVRSEI